MGTSILPDLTKTFCLLLISVFALAQNPVEPRALDWQDFRGKVYQSGNFFISGQPLTQAAMVRLESEGIKTIINLRTVEEMADRESTPIDEAALSDDLGFEYVHLPSGGDETPFSPGTTAALAEVLDKAKGKVLLHCRSGRRASHLWVAYLVEYLGMDVNSAVRLGQAANFGRMPLEGYLTNDLEYRTSASRQGEQ
jgi:uncharacterized protein (TIGR01244 family)